MKDISYVNLANRTLKEQGDAKYLCSSQIITDHMVVKEINVSFMSQYISGGFAVKKNQRRGV